MKKLFGTDGIRGLAGEFPLDAETVAVAGRALARIETRRSGRRPRFLTGRDTRESGSWIEAAFHRGAAAGGAQIESAGVMTTPGVALLTRDFGFDAGIVISASHNPFADNGVKIFEPSGRKLDASVEREIEAEIAAGEPVAGAPEGFGVDSRRADEFARTYADSLANAFGGLDLSGRRIVVDCANGAAAGLARSVFGRFGGDVTFINDRPDGRNINLDCGSLHLGGLQAAVLEKGADIGIAFDGDADRALFVDERGELVDGDGVLWMMACLLDDNGGLEERQIVATVMSNIGLELALRTRGIGLTRTAVGDKYVLEELIASGAPVGGEQSGHIIFPKRSLVGDGMMTALYVLEAMFEKRVSLSGAVAGFVRYPQVLVNVRVSRKLPFEDVPEIRGAAERLEREIGSAGRLLLRYSGTENLARVMIEGSEQSVIEAQAESLAGVIRASLG